MPTADTAADPPPPPSPGASVRIGEPPPSSNCEGLGEVRGSASRVFRSLDSAIAAATEAMQAQGEKLGADVVRKTGMAGDSREVVITGDAYRCAGKAAVAPRDAPTGAAGFVFGESEHDAQRRCEASGFAWTMALTGYGRCSGAPVDTGLGTDVAIRFCEERVCAIALTATPKEHTSAAWLDVYKRVSDALHAKYGAQASHTPHIPTTCRKDVYPCLDSGAAYVETRWDWKDGQHVVLRMGTLEKGEGDAAIRLRYEALREGVRPSVGGL